jgi:internalin A
MKLKEIKIIYGLLLILMVHTIQGQTVTLPDTNFRNALLEKHPSVIQGNNLLISKAATLTGMLNLSRSNITDATGLEHFTNITSLDLSVNNLKTIPDISSISGLINFYASNNQLDSLPDMSALTLLTDFQVMNNQLTKLPDLTKASNLRSLYFSNNKIIEIPPLSVFPNLTNLVIGDNPLSQPIDFSSCVNLAQLHIHRTKADTIIGLDKLKNLTTLYAWGNQISDFSGLDSLSEVSIIVIHQNPVKKIPYLDNKPDLTKVAVKQSNLTFEEIEPVKKGKPGITFDYLPQNQLDLFKNKSARDKGSYTFSYPIKTPSPNNIYVWAKNGKVIDSSTNASFTISPVAFADSGTYSLTIYNSYITDLTLYSNSFRLTIKPCIEFNIPFADIIEKDCSKGYKIDLSNAHIAGGNPPYMYQLNNNTAEEKYNNAQIQNVAAGIYEVKIIDSKKCEATDTIVLNRIENCDPVITPNGDGIADTYFIDKKGTAQIYDLRRKLVRKLECPVIWDGTDQHGVLLDTGLYFIIFDNHSPINVTIIR